MQAEAAAREVEVEEEAVRRESTRHSKAKSQREEAFRLRDQALEELMQPKAPGPPVAAAQEPPPPPEKPSALTRPPPRKLNRAQLRWKLAGRRVRMMGAGILEQRHRDERAAKLRAWREEEEEEAWEEEERRQAKEEDKRAHRASIESLFLRRKQGSHRPGMGGGSVGGGSVGGGNRRQAIGRQHTARGSKNWNSLRRATMSDENAMAGSWHVLNRRLSAKSKRTKAAQSRAAVRGSQRLRRPSLVDGTSDDVAGYLALENAAHDELRDDYVRQQAAQQAALKAKLSRKRSRHQGAQRLHSTASIPAMGPPSGRAPPGGRGPGGPAIQ